MSQPTVSVVVPTYNREALLPRALDSIVAQTFGDWEIVLVDDGSTDGTAAVASRYAARFGDRFLFIRQPNRGSSAARNTGIEACRGCFVAFLDSDDEFLPTKLERQVTLFDLCPELGLVYSDYAFVDLDGVYHDSMFDTVAPLAREVPHESIATGLCVCTGALFDVLLRGYFIPTIVGMVRREVLSRSIRFPEDQTYAEEWLFYLKVVRSCRAGFVDESLCLHHFVTGSITRTDKHRNLVRLWDLLLEVNAAFDDLTRAQRAVIRRHLVKTRRQLGYEAFKAGDHRAAISYLVQVASREPGWRALYDLAHAGVRWIGGGSIRAGAARSLLDP